MQFKFAVNVKTTIHGVYWSFGIQAEQVDETKTVIFIDSKIEIY